MCCASKCSSDIRATCRVHRILYNIFSFLDSCSRVSFFSSLRNFVKLLRRSRFRFFFAFLCILRAFSVSGVEQNLVSVIFLFSFVLIVERFGSRFFD